MLNWVQKRALPIAALTITDPALYVAYRHWSGKRRGTEPPPRRLIDTPVFRLLVPDALWLAADAYAGRLRPFLAATAADGRGPTLGEAQALDLDGVRAAGLPALQLIEIRVRDRPLVFQRLLLPTADDGSGVAELLEVCKPGGIRLVQPGVALA